MSVKLRELDYNRSACAFAEQLDTAAVGALELLLRSRTASDALEALKIFLRARAFALPCGARGVLAALALVLAAESSLRAAAHDAFAGMFLCAPPSGVPAAAGAGPRVAHDAPLSADEAAKALVTSPRSATRWSRRYGASSRAR